MIRSKKELEVILSRLRTFDNPKLELEQYSTSPSIAAKLLWIAYLNGDIENKTIIDACAGTGILGIGALLLGARNVTFVEIDEEVIKVLLENLSIIEKEFPYIKGKYHIINEDFLNFNSEEKFDTGLMNPPFGIQSRNNPLIFLQKLNKISKVSYAILNPLMKGKLSNCLLLFEDEMYIGNIYWFHEKKSKLTKVIAIKCKYY